MIKVSKYQKVNSTNPKKRDEYLRIKMKGSDGRWNPFTVSYKATSAQVESLQDLASEIVFVPGAACHTRANDNTLLL